MRKYLLGSLIGHVGLTVVGSLLSVFFLSAPASVRVMKLDLQNLSLPESRPEPEAQAPPVQPEPEAVEPEPTEPEPEVPSPPAELPPRSLPTEIEADSGIPETETPPDLRAPEPMLPREPNAVEKPEEEPESAEQTRPREEDVDFLEPEAVEPAEEAPAETPVEGTQAEAEEVTQGGMVQAHSPEGVSDFYLARVQQKIGRRWRPTPGLVPGRDAAECLVHFRIGTEGEVIAPSVARSSGLTVFDRQALRAVIESGPLPPVPPRFAKAGLEIRFLFSYAP